MPPEDNAEGSAGDGRDDRKPESSRDGDDYAELKRAIAAERKRARDAEKAAEDAQREAEDLRQRSMSDQDKALEEARRDGERTARERHKSLETENLKLRVAIDLGLPAALVPRLQGDTEEDIRSDAAELSELMGLKSGGGGSGDERRDGDQERKNQDGDKGGKPQGRLDSGGGRRDGTPARGSIAEARERYKAEREARESTKVDPYKGWGPRVGGNITR